MDQTLTKVILADDLALFRAGLAEILAAEPDLVVAAEARDFTHLELAIEQHPHAVVVSASHLQTDIASLVGCVRAAHSRCILLTHPGESEIAYLVQGVDAVVPRNSTAPTFLSVIRGVGLRDELLSAPSGSFIPLLGVAIGSLLEPGEQGDAYNPGKKQPLAEKHTEVSNAHNGQHLRERLTPKEIKILTLVVGGCSCKQIAAKLTTPEQAVKNYLRALLNSTESSDLSELAEFTVAHRLLEPTIYATALFS